MVLASLKKWDEDAAEDKQQKASLQTTMVSMTQSNGHFM